MTTDQERTAQAIRLTYAAYGIHAAREDLANAMDTGRTATREATTAGMSEVQIARRMEMNRRTIRRWLDK